MSCYFPAKFNVSISFAVVFLQPFEPRHHFLSIGCRLSLSLSLSLSMSPRYRHCLSTISPPDPRSHPFSGFMAPPLDSRSRLSRLRLRYLFCFLIILFRRNLVFSQHHRLFPVFRNYTSATFLVTSDRGRGVLKASWTRPSSYFKRSGPTKLPNQEKSPFRLGQRTVCRRRWRFEESLDQTKAGSVVDVRADVVRNSEHWLPGQGLRYLPTHKPSQRNCQKSPHVPPGIFDIILPQEVTAVARRFGE